MKFKIMGKCDCGCGERVFVNLKLGSFNYAWTMDAGEWFMYIRIAKRYWRFSSTGYMRWKE